MESKEAPVWVGTVLAVLFVVGSPVGLMVWYALRWLVHLWMPGR